MKSIPDEERFARYQSVVNALLSREFFSKPDVYAALPNEQKPFIGKVIGELVRDGFLTKDGLKSRPHYSWSEKRTEFNPGCWIDQRVFAPTVKRSPSLDRPRERLLRIGPAKLKTSELLAILIRSGLHGESAMQAGEKLAALFGDSLQDLSQKARGELKQVSKAIGETAYCQIMAALELGKRLDGQKEADSQQPHKITSTSDALAYCQAHFRRLAQEASQEELHVILLNDKHHIIKTEQITVGLSNKSLAHPREVFKPAIRESASAVILVHNHPSGDPTPSQDDRNVTKELKRAADTLGIRVLDHVIVAKDSVLSMVEQKVL
jgi:DNA repair protein RadC